jgi:hypothetical protein
MNPKNEKQALVNTLLAKNLGFKPPISLCRIHFCYLHCHISCRVYGPVNPA